MSSKAEEALPDEQRRILWGIGLVCLAASIFPIMNAASKWLAQDYSSLQVSWARFTGHVLLVLIVFLPTRGWRIVLTRRPRLQLARSTVQACSNMAFVASIAIQPIADAAAISMMGPLFVILLAWPILGERVAVGHALAVVVGFVGVLIVIRPGSDVFHVSALGLVLSAVCYALYQIITRKVANIDPPETTTFYSSVVGAVGMLPILPFVWQTPRDLIDLAFFCSMGTLGALGHYMVVKALSFAPASIVSPFQYFQLIGSVVIGFLVWNHFPDLATWLGAGVIIGAGLYVGWTQARKR